eukprot:4752669-Ditylum_brightwellii.AAC.1
MEQHLDCADLRNCASPSASAMRPFPLQEPVLFCGVLLLPATKPVGERKTACESFVSIIRECDTF